MSDELGEEIFPAFGGEHLRSDTEEIIVFMKAIAEENWPSVRRLLRSKNARFFVQFIFKDGCNALHHAIEVDAPLDVIELMVAANPTASTQLDNVGGETPFHSIVRYYDNENIVKTFIDACPRVASIVTDNGCTPLHLAIVCNSPPSIIRLLLSAHPSAISAKNECGDTPADGFFSMLNMGMRNTLKTAQENGCSISDLVAQTPLKEIQISEIYDTTILLLQAATNGITVDHQVNFPSLHAAISTPRYPWSFCNMILKVDPKQSQLQDHKGNFALHIAAATQTSYDGELYKCVECRSRFKSSTWYHNKIFLSECCLKCYSDENLSEEEYILTHSIDKISDIIKDLVLANPKVVSFPNHDGKLPFHIAIEHDKSFEEESVKTIFQAAPQSLSTRDIMTHMYPFMLAAVRKEDVSSEEFLKKFTCCFAVLVENPVLVSSGVPKEGCKRKQNDDSANESR